MLGSQKPLSRNSTLLPSHLTPPAPALSYHHLYLQMLILWVCCTIHHVRV